MPREDQTGRSAVYSSFSAWLWCAVTIRAIILCCVFLFSACLYAQRNTDVIVMKNGDRFTCEIKGLSAGVLSVKVKPVPVQQVVVAVCNGQPTAALPGENSKIASCVVALGCCVGIFVRGTGSDSRTPVGRVDAHHLLYRYPSNSHSYVGEL